MKITLDIPDHLAPTVLALYQNKEEPDDDGRSCAHIIGESGLSIDEFVKATHLLEGIFDRLELEIKDAQTRAAHIAMTCQCPCHAGGWNGEGVCKQPCDECACQ